MSQCVNESSYDMLIIANHVVECDTDSRLITALQPLVLIVSNVSLVSNMSHVSRDAQCPSRD